MYARGLVFIASKTTEISYLTIIVNTRIVGWLPVIGFPLSKLMDSTSGFRPFNII